MPETKVYLSINDIGPMVGTVALEANNEPLDLTAPDSWMRGPKMWRAEVPHCLDRQFRRLHLAADADRPVEVRFYGPRPGGPVYVGNAGLTVDTPHDLTARQVCWALSLRSIGSLHGDY